MLLHRTLLALLGLWLPDMAQQMFPYCCMKSYTFPCLQSLQVQTLLGTLCSKIITLGAHAQRGLQYSVSMCVCLRLFSHCRQRSGIRAIPTAPAQQAIENKNGDFAKTKAFEIEKLGTTLRVTQPIN